MVIGIAFRAFKEAITSEEERLEKASKLRNSGHFLEAEHLLDQNKRTLGIIQGPIFRRIGNWIDRLANEDVTECDARIKYMVEKFFKYFEITKDYPFLSPEGTKLKVSIFNQLIKTYTLFGPHKTDNYVTPLIVRKGDFSLREIMLYIEYTLAQINSQLAVIHHLASSRMKSISDDIEDFNENFHKVDEILCDDEELRESMKLKFINENNCNTKEKLELQSVLKTSTMKRSASVLTYFKSAGPYITDLLWAQKMLSIDGISRIIFTTQIPEGKHEEYDYNAKLECKKQIVEFWKEKREENPNHCEDYNEIREILREKFEIDLPEIAA